MNRHNVREVTTVFENRRKGERGKKMSKTSDVLSALAALDLESQAKVLAALDRQALAGAIARKAEVEKAEAEKARSALAEVMAKIGNLLDGSGVKESITFYRDQEKWNFSVGKTSKSTRTGSKRTNFVLDVQARDFLSGAKFSRDPEKCKPSGACEVWIAEAAGEKRKVPAVVLVFWAIGRTGGKSEKKISEFLKSAGVDLTGGQIRGALLRYDGALETGMIQ